MEFNYYTPVVTIFDKNGNIDKEENKKVYDFLIENGIKGILILGSTGEFYTMPLEEKKEFVKMAISYINNRAKIFIGAGSCNLEETIEFGNFALKNGADGLMVISPYYFCHSQQEIVSYYDTVAKNINGNMYIYNFPDRTGYTISPESLKELLFKNKNIVGIKDSVVSMSHTRKLLTTVQEDYPNFEVYSGFDENLMHNRMSGGAGCISALSNIFPEICVAWTEAILKEDLSLIFKYQKIINKLMDLYEINQSFISTLKKGLVLRKIIKNDYSRKPVMTLSEKETEKLIELFEYVGISI